MSNGQSYRLLQAARVVGKLPMGSYPQLTSQVPDRLRIMAMNKHKYLIEHEFFKSSPMRWDVKDIHCIHVHTE
jgi:hypothetical protein